MLPVSKLRLKEKMKYFLIYVIGQLCLYVYVKPFYNEGILYSEIKISGFSIIRCDRVSRAGGGVYVYVSHSTTYDICFTYSNTLCELLILRLQKHTLIIIIMYIPPLCPAED